MLLRSFRVIVTKNNHTSLGVWELAPPHCNETSLESSSSLCACPTLLPILVRSSSTASRLLCIGVLAADRICETATSSTPTLKLSLSTESTNPCIESFTALYIILGSVYPTGLVDSYNRWHLLDFERCLSLGLSTLLHLNYVSTLQWLDRFAFFSYSQVGHQHPFSCLCLSLLQWVLARLREILYDGLVTGYGIEQLCWRAFQQICTTRITSIKLMWILVNRQVLRILTSWGTH